jgi:hypothetical protein
MYGWAGLRTAFLLTGDQRYLDVWRTQIDTINAQRRMRNGRWEYPRMYGPDGWYGWTPEPYAENALELYALSMRPDDAQRAGSEAWLRYLAGQDPDYPERVLRQDLARIRQRVQGLRGDTSTPDTRLADDPMKYNPASVHSLIPLMLGGVHPGVGGNSLTARVRYFDWQTRRPGLPPGVSALVEQLTDDAATITLVNVDPVHPRILVVQGGAYAEHQIVAAQTASAHVEGVGPRCLVRLAPGAGGTIRLTMRRHVLPPTLKQPWTP